MLLYELLQWPHIIAGEYNELREGLLPNGKWSWAMGRSVYFRLARITNRYGMNIATLANKLP